MLLNDSTMRSWLASYGRWAWSWVLGLQVAVCAVVLVVSDTPVLAGLMLSPSIVCIALALVAARYDPPMPELLCGLAFGITLLTNLMLVFSVPLVIVIPVFAGVAMVISAREIDRERSASLFALLAGSMVGIAPMLLYITAFF